VPPPFSGISLLRGIVPAPPLAGRGPGCPQPSAGSIRSLGLPPIRQPAPWRRRPTAALALGSYHVDRNAARHPGFREHLAQGATAMLDLDRDIYRLSSLIQPAEPRVPAEALSQPDGDQPASGPAGLPTGDRRGGGPTDR